MNKRGYSIKEVDEMGFPIWDYDFPAGRGEFTGTLVLKRWNEHLALICYFDTDQGEKLKLCIWFKYDNERTYRPRNSDLDVSEIPLGSRVQVTFEPSGTGKSTVWLSASVMERYVPQQEQTGKTNETEKGAITYV